MRFIMSRFKYNLKDTKRIIGKIKKCNSSSERNLNLLLKNEHLLNNIEIQEGISFILLGYSAIQRILEKDSISL